MTSGRRLRPDERALAGAVFGSAIGLDRVRVHRGGFGRFAFTLGSHVFVPRRLALEGPSWEALLVHELTHVWQFQTRPLWTLASWARAVASGGYGPGLPAYRYRLPLDRFRRLGLERQASVVEHLFLLRRGSRVDAMAPGLSCADLEAACPFPMDVGRY